MQGCLTPLPRPGDYVLAKNHRFYRFVEVEPMGNPRDGFSGRVEMTDSAWREDAPPGAQLPSFAEIEAFVRSET